MVYGYLTSTDNWETVNWIEVAHAKRHNDVQFRHLTTRGLLFSMCRFMSGILDIPFASLRGVPIKGNGFRVTRIFIRWAALFNETQGSTVGAFLTSGGIALRQRVSYLDGNHASHSVDNSNIILSVTAWNEIFGSDDSFNYGDSCFIRVQAVL